ncbi:MAG: hypothetical protein KBE91_02400 [Bacteroidia bacterium]|nr:hypothetical protein [Bacteroidia bacterium]MBP9688433.1 hypothetical protein [Bacteroidia bacterium]
MQVKDNYTTFIQNHFENGLKLNQIKAELIKIGIDENLMEVHLKYARNLQYKKQQAIGTKLLLLGAFLCIAGCVLTFFHVYSPVYTGITLYGMTITGACFVLAGLGLILG